MLDVEKDKSRHPGLLARIATAAYLAGEDRTSQAAADVFAAMSAVTFDVPGVRWQVSGAGRADAIVHGDPHAFSAAGRCQWDLGSRTSLVVSGLYRDGTTLVELMGRFPSERGPADGAPHPGSRGPRLRWSPGRGDGSERGTGDPRHRL